MIGVGSPIRGRRTTFAAEAPRSDGKRFVVRAHEKLTAFVKLESELRTAEQWTGSLKKFGVTDCPSRATPNIEARGA